MTLYTLLEPMLRSDPARWRGLPATSPRVEFDTLFGPPEECLDSLLGYYPARRCVYRDHATGRGLVVWEREGLVVMVEAMTLPTISVLKALPAPSSVLAHEILIPGAYAHEYLYCATGLILTVAQALQQGGQDHIARCRGIKPLDSIDEFGPAYYRAFEDRVQWDDLQTEET